jgi:hypothetical protein
MRTGARYLSRKYASPARSQPREITIRRTEANVGKRSGLMQNQIAGIAR